LRASGLLVEQYGDIKKKKWDFIAKMTDNSSV
jgi:hypothetical protein